MTTERCITDGFGTSYRDSDWGLHRDNGPAYLSPSGYQAWFQHGKRHRTDGPAIIHSDGTEEYWLNGEQVDIIVHFLQRKD